MKPSFISNLKKLDFIRPAALGITFLTGFSGLVYEVTWHRYLANLIGSHSKAAAVILAVFLGGLCAGYALFGRFSENRSPRSLLRLYGITEGIIGLWVFLFPYFYLIIWKKIGIIDPSFSLSILSDIFLCILLIGLPTVLMGGTLPLLTQGLSKDLADASPFHARIYAVNTGGAFLGCLIAGFVLLPFWGLKQTIQYTGLINIFGGIFLFWMGNYLSTKIEEEPIKTSESPSPLPSSIPGISLLLGCVVAFLAGFYALSLQTVFMRLVGLSIGSSEYAFSMIVSVYILMLALGAWRLSKKETPKIPLWVNQLIAFAGILIVFFLIPWWPYAFNVIRVLLTSVKLNFYNRVIYRLLGHFYKVLFFP